MLCINSKQDDPFFNLAAEELLLKTKSDDVFMLWSGKPSVVVGKHQNALGEINYHYVKDNNIAMARRLSGGGTVFHDKGNLNFTWILNGETGKLVDFKKFIDPIVEFLNQYNIKAERGKRNDIIINEKKISGNAEHVFKNRTLHHGTLLFDSNLNSLRNSLKIKEKRYYDKAVKSNPHPVANFRELSNCGESFDQFRTKLFSFILDKERNNLTYDFSNEEKDKIEILKKEKYNTWEWIYGYSPEYRFVNGFIFNKEKITVELKVKKGIIYEANIKNIKDKTLKRILTKALENNLHKEDEIRQKLDNEFMEEQISNMDIDGFLYNIF